MFWKFNLGLPRNTHFPKSDRVKGLSRELRWNSREASAASQPISGTKTVTTETKGRGYDSLSCQIYHRFPIKCHHGWIWEDTGSSYHRLNLNCFWWIPSPPSPQVCYFIFNLNCRILKSLPAGPDMLGLTQGEGLTSTVASQSDGEVPKDQHHPGKLFKCPIPWLLPRPPGWEPFGMGFENLYIYKVPQVI